MDNSLCTTMCEAHALEALLTLVSVKRGTVGRGHIRFTTVILGMSDSTLAGQSTQPLYTSVQKYIVTIS